MADQDSAAATPSPASAPARLSVLVTGSTSGIGLAIAEGFAAAGHNVMLNGLGDAAEIEGQRRRLDKLGAGSVAFHAADMSQPAEIENLIEACEQRFGQLDVLVNNAGIQHVAAIEDFPPSKWDAILAINLSSAFHTARLTVPAMKARGWGRIINIASAHALVASPFKTAYVAAKHGLLGLTKSLALEVAQNGITVNAICPGYVKTPLVEKQIPDTARSRGISEAEVINEVMLKPQPTKRFVGTEEIAALALFLASDGARSITGSHQSIDGGWTAQ